MLVVRLALCRISIVLFLFLSSVAFSEGETKLEILLSSENPSSLLTEYVKRGLTIKALEDEYNDSSIPSAEKKKFLNQHRQAIKDLRKLEQQIKATISSAIRTRWYHGDPDTAIDAGVEEIAFYKMVEETLEACFKDHSINKRVFDLAKQALNSLKHLHRNNKAINLEFEKSETSSTYKSLDGVFSLHPRTEEPFQLKAASMFGQLKLAFEFSRDNKILSEFFRHALAKSKGCLEAHYRHMFDWYLEQVERMRDLRHMSTPKRREALPVKGEEAILDCIENNDLPMDNQEERQHSAQALAFSLEGKSDVNGGMVGYEDAYSIIKRLVLASPSPVKPVHVTEGSEKSGKSELSRNLFGDDGDSDDGYESDEIGELVFQADLASANQQSYQDIRQTRLLDQSLLRVRLQAVPGDGNCGFSALQSPERRISRERFIHDVRRFVSVSTHMLLGTPASLYVSPRNPNVRAALENEAMRNAVLNKIREAMRRANVQTLQEWSSVFARPEYWMDETHIEIYALMYGVHVRVHELNHDENRFNQMFSFNVGAATTADIVNINTRPIEGPNDIALNHFDRLVVVSSETPLVQPGFPSPLVHPGSIAVAALVAGSVLNP